MNRDELARKIVGVTSDENEACAMYIYRVDPSAFSALVRMKKKKLSVSEVKEVLKLSGCSDGQTELFIGAYQHINNNV